MKTEWLAQLFIEVNGADLATKYMDRLIEVEVDDSLYLPDMFTIHLEDPNLEALRADVFQLGASIKISVGIAARISPTRMITMSVLPPR